MIPSRSQVLRGHWTGWNRERIAPLGSWNLLVVMMYMCDPNTQADTGGSQFEARIHSMVLFFKREVRAQYPFVITASSACLYLACFLSSSGTHCSHWAVSVTCPTFVL